MHSCPPSLPYTLLSQGGEAPPFRFEPRRGWAHMPLKPLYVRGLCYKLFSTQRRSATWSWMSSPARLMIQNTF
eukprot:3815465-Amphidinium_carterae.2